KLDAAGKHVWSKQFGDGTLDTAGLSVVTADAGNVVVAGSFKGAIDFGGGPLNATYASGYVAKLTDPGAPLWSKVVEVLDAYCATDGSGNVFVTGRCCGGSVGLGGGALPDAGGTGNIFVLKLDGNGKYVWSKGFQTTGSKAFSRANAIAVDADGNVIVAGDI